MPRGEGEPKQMIYAPLGGSPANMQSVNTPDPIKGEEYLPGSQAPLPSSMLGRAALLLQAAPLFHLALPKPLWEAKSRSEHLR